VKGLVVPDAQLLELLFTQLIESTLLAYAAQLGKMGSPHQCVILTYETAGAEYRHTMLAGYVCYLGDLCLKKVFIFALAKHCDDL